MHRLLCVVILTLAGLNAGTAAFPAAADRPVVYLFGESHGSLEALQQEDCLKRYASANKIMLALEAYPFDAQAFHAEEALRNQPNMVGCESSFFYAIHGFEARFDGHKNEAYIFKVVAEMYPIFNYLSTISHTVAKLITTKVLNSYYNHYRNSYMYGNVAVKVLFTWILGSTATQLPDYIVWGLKNLNYALVNMINPDLAIVAFYEDPDLKYLPLRNPLIATFLPEWDDFFNTINNERLKEDTLFKKIVKARALVRATHFDNMTDRLNANEWAAKELEAYANYFYTREENMAFVRLFVDSILAYLKTKKQEQLFPLINECLNAADALYYSDENFLPESDSPAADARNYPIACNLEYMQPFAAQRGLLLAGVYGSSHILPLKTILEARGFEVITDDMAALEAAIAGDKRVKDEL